MDVPGNRRFSNPIRYRFSANGETTSLTPEHAKYLRVANKVLEGVLSSASYSGLPQHNRRIKLEDGTTIYAATRFGQQELRINLPIEMRKKKPRKEIIALPAQDRLVVGLYGLKTLHKFSEKNGTASAEFSASGGEWEYIYDYCSGWNSHAVYFDWMYDTIEQYQRNPEGRIAFYSKSWELLSTVPNVASCLDIAYGNGRHYILSIYSSGGVQSYALEAYSERGELKASINLPVEAIYFPHYLAVCGPRIWVLYTSSGGDSDRDGNYIAMYDTKTLSYGGSVDAPRSVFAFSANRQGSGTVFGTARLGDVPQADLTVELRDVKTGAVVSTLACPAALYPPFNQRFTFSGIDGTDLWMAAVDYAGDFMGTVDSDNAGTLVLYKSKPPYSGWTASYDTGLPVTSTYYRSFDFPLMSDDYTPAPPPVEVETEPGD